MAQITHDEASAVAGAAPDPETGLLVWLDGMLDIAHDRADAALARLIAALMDDFGAVAARCGTSTGTARPS